MAGGPLDTWMRSGRSNGATKRKVDDISNRDQQPAKRTKEVAKSRSLQDTTAAPNLEPSTPRSSSTSNQLQITEESGDIFDAPNNTLLIHACNCDGSWGAGIAKAFRDRYPAAHDRYAEHCDDSGGDLVGTALFIPPVAHNKSANASSNKHPVGCLFTSRHYGRRKDSPAKILAATKPALEDLLKQVQDFNSQAADADRVREVRICKINSGLFKVPWEKTRAALEQVDVSGCHVKVIKVVSPD